MEAPAAAPAALSSPPTAASFCFSASPIMQMSSPREKQSCWATLLPFNIFSSAADCAAASASFTSFSPANASSSVLLHSAAAVGEKPGLSSRLSLRCLTPAAAETAAEAAAAAGATAAAAAAAAAMQKGVAVSMAKGIVTIIVAVTAAAAGATPSLVAAAAAAAGEGEAAADDGGLTRRFAYVDSLHTLLVLGLGLAVAACSELLSYFLIYRFEEFRRLQNECRALWKEYYDAWEIIIVSLVLYVTAASLLCCQHRVSTVLHLLRCWDLFLVCSLPSLIHFLWQIASYRQKGNLVVGLIVMISMPMVYACFDDRAAAFLPFHPIFPFSMILRYTPDSSSNDAVGHSPADGGAAAAAGSYAVGDPPPAGATLCSAAGFFMLTVMMTRANLQKFLGFAAPGGSQQQQKLFTLHTS